MHFYRHFPADGANFIPANALARPKPRGMRGQAVHLTALRGPGVSNTDTDSFINEVTEEVRRDRLFALMRRYGWIAALAVVVLVGGAAWNEFRKAQATAQAQAFGDAILSALENELPDTRMSELAAIEAPQPGAQAVLDMLMAAEAANNDDDADAVARLQAVANQTELPTVYRQIASYKALTRGADVLSVDERRTGLEALAQPGQPLNLLAKEQLALIDIETGQTSAALERLQAIAQDATATAGLRRRATQLIVALGGTPDEG